MWTVSWELNVAFILIGDIIRGDSIARIVTLGLSASACQSEYLRMTRFVFRRA